MLKEEKTRFLLAPRKKRKVAVIWQKNGKIHRRENCSLLREEKMEQFYGENTRLSNMLFAASLRTIGMSLETAGGLQFKELVRRRRRV